MQLPDRQQRLLGFGWPIILHAAFIDWPLDFWQTQSLVAQGMANYTQ